MLSGSLRQEVLERFHQLQQKPIWQFTFNCVSGGEFLDPQDAHMHTKSHSLLSDTGHLVAV